MVHSALNAAGSRRLSNPSLSLAGRGEQPYRLAVALNFIIDAALLRLLGFEEEQVTATFARNRRFSSR
jgi:hypothetical protein